MQLQSENKKQVYLSGPEKINFYFYLFIEQLFGKTKLKRAIYRHRELFFKKIALKYKDYPDGKMTDVDSHTQIKTSFFKSEYFNKTKPVVFKGAAKEWPCCQKWSLEYFNKLLGKKDVLLVDAEGLTTRKTKDNFEVLSVEDLVSNITSGGDKYLRFSPLLQQNLHLEKDLNLQWLNSLKSWWSIGNTYYLFMGGKKTVTHLHCDQPCNLFIQVFGKKKWTLFGVDQSHLLYPQATQTAYFKSLVNLSDPDYAAHPLIKKATRWEVVLEPGDVLYVPPHVWHYVENLTDSIGVGFRFSSVVAATKASTFFTFLRFCAQNPPFWKTRKYGKIDTNLIWAEANGRIKEVLKVLSQREKDKQK